VFENRVLRRILLFSSKGERRKLHDEDLHDLYTSPDIGDQIEEDKMGGHAARIPGI
jgi:hypothetical protein